MTDLILAPAPAPVDPRDRGGAAQPMLIVENFKKYFPIRAGLLSRKVGEVKAVDDISFYVLKGETLGIVGESGCGKSTLARLLMYLIDRDEGHLILDGDPVGEARGVPLNGLRRSLQMVFQDSYSSLNPRLPIETSIAYGPKVQGASAKDAKDQARALLQKVGLKPNLFGQRYPHELSGGQKQRVNIARALALDPRLLILDEAVSALDKSVEAQVLNLLADLKGQLNLTYIFISHDLHVVRYISDRVLVMYLGQVVEIGPVGMIYEDPKHPYTQALLECRLSMDPDERVEQAPLAGDPPNPVNPPSGCRFHTRCRYVEDVCVSTMPDLGNVLQATPERHLAACHMVHAGSGHSRAPAMADA
ncbi:MULTISPECIES: oligopeptide/dipeptide ABC transporter ATP-binding protein [unclassified Rhizobium]|uniref:ABC transporter ATP-binding protein n=1 Tax=unclassified Rhizobium TaxID=2613769 RepID=UPI001160884F|nr:MULTISPECIES: oligopeptide/dipeptide ABC transporter ATP-binding protein [unclassified Rhizobium]TQX85225.1 ATP-binding cassette domain-containing protein [Rhizobium sp. rho-13.1]TQY09513.1 ATP-binding cassette domain-containing protein [Rhizobium sp. rho-1.1]